MSGRLRTAALLTLGALATSTAGGAPAVRATGDRPAPTLAELVGQRLVVAMEGTTPTASLLERIRRGEVGGVILFAGNVHDPAQVRALTSSLQAAASAGGRPPLIIAADQEGGEVRRLRWAAPVSSASALGSQPPAAVRVQGRAAGRALAAVGVRLDLAPVADVPGRRSFMAAERRTFSSDPLHVASRATAFAAGLRDAGVLAAVKHFPGIGRATRNTDTAAVVLAGDDALSPGLVPFRAAIAAGVPVVMLANASYEGDAATPASWSPRIQTFLRRQLGFSGVTITDSLDVAAATRRRSLPSAAVLAAQAGVDLLLLAGTEASSAAVFERLVERAEQGRIPVASLRRSYGRVVELKRGLRLR